MPPLELRRLRLAGWRFAYDPASGQIRPTKPAGATDQDVLEAKRVIQSVRDRVVLSLREEAALDRLDTSRLSSLAKEQIDALAEAGEIDRLESLVDGYVAALGRGVRPQEKVA